MLKLRYAIFDEIDLNMLVHEVGICSNCALFETRDKAITEAEIRGSNCALFETRDKAIKEAEIRGLSSWQIIEIPFEEIEEIQLKKEYIVERTTSVTIVDANNEHEARIRAEELFSENMGNSETTINEI